MKYSFTLKSYKSKCLEGNLSVPSDKSISIRSFLIGSIGNNISIVKNALNSEDVFSTINCLKKLGVKIKKTSNKEYFIYGKTLGSLYLKKNEKLDFGKSGTSRIAVLRR